MTVAKDSYDLAGAPRTPQLPAGPRVQHPSGIPPGQVGTDMPTSGDGVGVFPVSGYDLIGTVAKATQDLVAGFDFFLKGHVQLHRLTGTRISAVSLPCFGVIHVVSLTFCLCRKSTMHTICFVQTDRLCPWPFRPLLLHVSTPWQPVPLGWCDSHGQPCVPVWKSYYALARVRSSTPVHGELSSGEEPATAAPSTPENRMLRLTARLEMP